MVFSAVLVGDSCPVEQKMKAAGVLKVRLPLLGRAAEVFPMRQCPRGLVPIRAL